MPPAVIHSCHRIQIKTENRYKQAEAEVVPSSSLVEGILWEYWEANIV